MIWGGEVPKSFYLTANNKEVKDNRNAMTLLNGKPIILLTSKE